METDDLSHSRQTEVLIVAWVTTGVAIVVVGLKLFSRAKLVQQTGWDDYLIFLALIMSVIATCFVHSAVRLGFGRHTAHIAAESGNERLFKTGKIQMLGYPFNIAAFSLPNISIAILVVHILDPNQRRNTSLYCMVGLQNVLAIITIVIAFAQCRPTQKLWEKTLPGSCWGPDVLNNFSYGFCAYTALTDIVLAVVPIQRLWLLQMPMAQKIKTCVMMGITMLSAIVTIKKGTYLPLFTDTTDPLYNPVPLVLWGLVEQNVVIVAASVTSLRPFCHIKRRLDSSGPFAESSMRQDHIRRREDPGVELDDMDEDVDDTASSQRGIVRTFEVSVNHDGSDEQTLSGQSLQRSKSSLNANAEYWDDRRL